MSHPDSLIDRTLGDGIPATDCVRPESLESLGESVRASADRSEPIFPQGGRTSLDYGGAPDRPGLAVDLLGLDRVIDYPVADMTITVQAGMTLAALQAILAREGQHLPLDAPRSSQATLGGIFATNTAGPRRFGSGRPRDLILGVAFVNARGELIRGGGRVVKNVAGYDFPRLLTGSLGTLGVLAEMTLKVRPLPQARAIAAVAFDRLADAEAFLERLNTSATRPVALDLLNRAAGSRLAAGPAESSAWTVAIGYEENEAAMRWQLDALRGEVGPGLLDAIEGEEASAAWKALTELTHPEAASLGLVAGVRPSAVAAIAGRLDAKGWAVHAHAGSGVVRGHRFGALSTRAEVEQELGSLRHLASSSGGNLIVSTCPTDWKATVPVWGHTGPDWAAMERVRRAFDPGRLMNPGRFAVRMD